MNSQMRLNSKHALLVAFHFPPFSGSSGFLRTVCFARYLSDVGWATSVLTADERAYPRLEPGNVKLIGDLDVHRAFALDSRRHLSVGGKYLRATALPDQWITWAAPAILKGVSLTRQNQTSVIWSTFPIPTSMIIGSYVSRLTGLPWVADIRDVIVDDEFPESRAERRSYSKLERRIFSQAAAVVVATDNAAAMYKERYPQHAEKLIVIRNGFDEEVFAKVESSIQVSARNRPRLHLLHSGLLSPVDRNPIPFFDALASAIKQGRLKATDLLITLRASSNEDQYADELRTRDLSEIVELRPAIAYEDAIREMMSVDGLVLFQGSSCNHAIPAKIYEYLRCKRPILVVADPEGETSRFMSDNGSPFVCDINDREVIADTLTRFVECLRDGLAATGIELDISRYSRQRQAEQLGKVLDQLAD